MTRRTLCIALLTALALMTALPTALAQGNVDIFGRELPADAAPYEMQVYRNLCDSARQETSLSSRVTVYSRICSTGAFDKFSDSLVVLNNNMEIIPSAATDWSVSDDGLTWTFNLRGDQMWSDGTPVTANDWVESWRFMADPDHAYDFVWLWLGIIDGWDEAVAGEIDPSEIGLEAVDDNTLAVTTQVPFPPLPATFFFWPPMQAKALTEIGPDYILDPATHVSAGPFILKEFEPGSHTVLEANFFTGDPATRIAMYQDAERMMVEDVGGVFLVHRIQGDLWQPYMGATGNCWEPDRQGLSTTHWGNEHCWGEYYITDEVMNYDTHRNE